MRFAGGYLIIEFIIISEIKWEKQHLNLAN